MENRSYRARIPNKFFSGLLPYNAELQNGNSMMVKAIGFKRNDDSSLRSKGGLQFGFGLATLLKEVYHPTAAKQQDYVFEFVLIEDGPPRNRFWQVNSAPDQKMNQPSWELCASFTRPDPDDGLHIIELVSQDGDPGQYFYLACVA